MNPERREQFYQANKEALHARLIADMEKSLRASYTVLDPVVCRAFATVPRHVFAPDDYFSRVYRNKIIPIETTHIREELIELIEEGVLGGEREDEQEIIDAVYARNNATNSEPGLIARMVQYSLTDAVGRYKHRSALEVGCGTGYVCAILRHIGYTKVVGIEQKPHLAQQAQEILADDPKIEILCQDGKDGLNDRKFDTIIVSALVRDATVIRNLAGQLKDEKSRLVAPVSFSILARGATALRKVPSLLPDKSGDGWLEVIRVKGSRVILEPMTQVRFVNLE